MKRKEFFQGLLAVIFAVGLATAAYADTYVIDPVHSSIGFSVEHLMVSEVQGQFGEFAGTVDVDPATSTITKADTTIQTKSIDTGNEKRDGHLRTADFFDAEKYPEITFKSSEVTGQDNAFNVTGDLTIKGITKKVTIPLTVAGPIKHPMSGDQIIGLSGTTTINRQDFGVSWNKQLDQGGLMVSDDVQLRINLEAGKK